MKVCSVLMVIALCLGSIPVKAQDGISGKKLTCIEPSQVWTALDQLDPNSPYDLLNGSVGVSTEGCSFLEDSKKRSANSEAYWMYHNHPSIFEISKITYFDEGAERNAYSVTRIHHLGDLGAGIPDFVLQGAARPIGARGFFTRWFSLVAMHPNWEVQDNLSTDDSQITFENECGELDTLVCMQLSRPMKVSEFLVQFPFPQSAFGPLRNHTLSDLQRFLNLNGWSSEVTLDTQLPKGSSVAYAGFNTRSRDAFCRTPKGRDFCLVPPKGSGTDATIGGIVNDLAKSLKLFSEEHYGLARLIALNGWEGASEDSIVPAGTAFVIVCLGCLGR